MNPFSFENIVMYVTLGMIAALVIAGLIAGLIAIVVSISEYPTFLRRVLATIAWILMVGSIVLVGVGFKVSGDINFFTATPFMRQVYTAITIYVMFGWLVPCFLGGGLIACIPMTAPVRRDAR